jgi:hypothetical protein
MQTVTKNLMFLLAAAPIATGCVVVSDDTANDETTGDGDGDPTTGDGDGDPTTGDGDGDPTTGDGDGDPTTGDGDGGCNLYAMKLVECYGSLSYAEVLEECHESLELAGGGGALCVLAFEEYLVCLSELDCSEFVDPTEACKDETEAIEANCR